MTFHQRTYSTDDTDNSSDFPGRNGPSATTEADPRDVGPVRTSYAPDRDGDPDPGEIVWTWVPFEEMAGRAGERAGQTHNPDPTPRQSPADPRRRAQFLIC